MYSKITLVELVDLIAESTSTSKRVCELFVRELFATVSQALIDGEKVKIKGIGTFAITRVKSRKSVNVAQGGAIEIAGYNRLTFTPDKALAQAVNHAFAQFETITIDDALTDEKLAEIDKTYPSLFNEEGERIETPVEESSSGEDQSSVASPAEEPAIISVEETVHGSSEPTLEAPSETAAPEVTEEPVTDQPESTHDEVSIDDVGLKALEAFGVPVHAVSPSETQHKPMTVENNTEPEPESTAVTHDDAQPAAPDQEEPDDGFFRPAPRNAYTPTQEQISRQKSRKNLRWLWGVLAALAVGLVIWLIASLGGKTDKDGDSSLAVASDSIVAEAEPAVITDTVTSQIVLSTLSDKYYDSPWFWVYIYEENKALISNPDNVPPGTVVVIPPAEKYGIDAKDPKSLKKAQYKSWEILKGK
ncbi:MAG: HU family DNA-binding protein [Muribaculaceae bacterium]|nr:HU family DNA-binding protein [Muribaculaceae bacterium]